MHGFNLFQQVWFYVSRVSESFIIIYIYMQIQSQFDP